MTALPPLLQGFFTDRLIGQRDASPHTVAAYRDCFRLLLGFVDERTGKTPSKLLLEDLDAATSARSSPIWSRRAPTACGRATPG